MHSAFASRREEVSPHVQDEQGIDEVRAQEAKELVRQGHEPLLKKTRWLLLKRPENLTQKQELRLAYLVRYNLRTVRSYLRKEDFQAFWE